MCGIGGIVNTNNSKIDPNIIENIKDSLEHRGPDNSSVKHISESNCFVHTRLSIIDLNDRQTSPSSQLMEDIPWYLMVKYITIKK